MMMPYKWDPFTDDELRVLLLALRATEVESGAALSADEASTGRRLLVDIRLELGLRNAVSA
jgi:hypothetical protein